MSSDTTADICQRIIKSGATIYRISLADLERYDSQYSASAITPDHRKQLSHAVMVMLPEGCREAIAGAIIGNIQQLHGMGSAYDVSEAGEAVSRGYVLVTNPEVIGEIIAAAPEHIRSFKNDLFPDSEVQPRPERNTGAWSVVRERVPSMRNQPASSTAHPVGR